MSNTTRSRILSSARLARATTYTYSSLGCGRPNDPSNPTPTTCPNVSEPSGTKMAFVLPSQLYLATASPRSGQPTMQASSLEQRSPEEALPGVRSSSPAMPLTTSPTVSAWSWEQTPSSQVTTLNGRATSSFYIPSEAPNTVPSIK